MARRWVWSWTRNARGLAALAGCLVIVAALLWVQPENDPERLEYVNTPLGEWTSVRNYDTRFTEVRLTRELVGRYDTRTPAHPGTVIVVVSWQLAAHDDQVLLGGVDLLTTAGQEYGERVDLCSDTYEPVQPGFTRTSVTCFEVPETRLRGARMVLGRPPSSLVSYSNAVAFELGVDERTPVLPQLVEPKALVEVTR